MNRDAFLQQQPDKILRFSILCRDEELIPFAEFKVVKLSASIRTLKHHPDAFLRGISNKAFKYVEECFKNYYPSDDLIRRILGLSLICPSVDEHFIQFFKRLNESGKTPGNTRLLTYNVRKIYIGSGWDWTNCVPEHCFAFSEQEQRKREGVQRSLKLLYEQSIREAQPKEMLSGIIKEYRRKFGTAINS